MRFLLTLGLAAKRQRSRQCTGIDLAISVAPYFRITLKDANAIIKRSQAVVAQWPKVARSLRIPEHEQQRMASAFRLAE